MGFFKILRLGFLAFHGRGMIQEPVDHGVFDPESTKYQVTNKSTLVWKNRECPGWTEDWTCLADLRICRAVKGYCYSGQVSYSMT